MTLASRAASVTRHIAYPVAGVGLAMALWWWLVHQVGQHSLMASRFSPENTWLAASQLWQGGDIWQHTRSSLQRVLLGLILALAAGVPIGLLVGSWRTFNLATSTTFQFLRMVSPLSWMPVAIMALGVGEAPVVFLLAFAAVWPIVLNVAAGIAAIDPQWLMLADSVGANRRENCGGSRCLPSQRIS